MRRGSTGHGKRFESQMLRALKMIPRSYATRHPGAVVARGRLVRYFPPKIDLLFGSDKGIFSIECKATRKDVFYFSQGMRPGQVQALRQFNKISPFFKGIIVIWFVKHRKVVVIDNLKLTKVTPDMPGVKRVNGFWNMKEYFNDKYRTAKRKKK